MIDFECTCASDTHIHFCNEWSETLKKYPLEDFEKYVKANNTIPEYENFMPMDVHSDYWGKYDKWCLERFIDDNFEQLTKDFYLSLNPTEHKANNTPQKTLRQVL